MINRYPSRRTHAAAFTLIELLLVLVILGVLLGIVVQKFTGRAEQARETAARTTIHSLSEALDLYEQDNGSYPSNEEGLQALVVQPPSARDWHGPYIKSTEAIPTDPWKNPFLYRYPGANNPNGFDLYSAGPDGREGGNDDITNWNSR